jgi:hypothetical protein
LWYAFLISALVAERSMFKTSMLVSDLIRFGCLAQTGSDTVEVDLVGHVGVCVDVGMCVLGDFQYVGRQSTRVFEMGKYFVFVVQIESEALVQSELNFLGAASRKLHETSSTSICIRYQPTRHSQHAHDITCQRVLSLVGSVYCTAFQGRHRAGKNLRVIVFKE